MKRWYLGSMNDGLFIIDAPPRPSTDDAWHDRPDGPKLVLNVVALTAEQAQAIVDAHNAGLTETAAWLPYPPGMGEESRRLHREYNALVAAQRAGAKNGAEVVRLTDECAAT